jgi:hypothetical protein
LAAIQLDEQPTLDAGEIGDIPADRMLTSKLVSRQSPISQDTPQATLSICREYSELARYGVRHLLNLPCNRGQSRHTLTRLATLRTLSRERERISAGAYLTRRNEVTRWR